MRAFFLALAILSLFVWPYRGIAPPLNLSEKQGFEDCGDATVAVSELAAMKGARRSPLRKPTKAALDSC